MSRLGPSLGVLEASWRRLGAVWGRLGTVLARLGPSAVLELGGDTKRILKEFSEISGAVLALIVPESL